MRLHPLGVNCLYLSGGVCFCWRVESLRECVALTPYVPVLLHRVCVYECLRRGVNDSYLFTVTVRTTT